MRLSHSHVQRTIVREAAEPPQNPAHSEPCALLQGATGHPRRQNAVAVG